ncbi:MAG TPA: hypothetical protein VHO68_00590 [Bacteroidales bacterium]|nr:hypothetical protein [Bacteroidales bacterium]
MIVKTYLFSLLLCVSLTTGAQVFYSPAVGLKSHETMEVLRIEKQAEKTVVYLSVENRIKGGMFCADRNIYLGLPDGTRLKMTESKGIPQCPDNYKFRKVGEKLEFSLTFPQVNQKAGWIDIIEDCSDNCFSLYGVLLNASISARISEAVLNVDRGEFDTAIGIYSELIKSIGPDEAGITGSLYVDLIELLLRKGYTAQASDYYKKLEASSLPRKVLYINNLNSRGVRF